MNRLAALAGVTVTTVDLAHLGEASSLHGDSRTNRIAVGLGTGQLKLRPVAAARGDSLIEERLLVSVDLEDVQLSVMIEIRQRQATTVHFVIGTSFTGDFLESLTSQIAEHLLLLVAAPGHAPNVGPVADVGEVHTGLEQEIVQEDRDVVLFARRAEAVDYVKIGPAIIVKITKLGSPAPESGAGIGFLGDIGEGAVVVVMPQHVAFLHIFIGDVGDVNVEETIVVVISDFGVHALAGVEADGLFGGIGKRAIAIVKEDLIGAIVAGDVQILITIVVEVPVAQIERPAGEFAETGFVGDVRELAFSVVMPECDSTTIDRVIEVIRQNVGIRQFNQVLGLEVIAEHHVDEAIIVVVEGDRSDSVAKTGEAGTSSNVFELTRTLVVIKDRRSKAANQEVFFAVIVVIEPKSVRHNGLGIVATSDPGFVRHFREGHIAVVVEQVVWLTVVGVGDEQIIKAVAIIVTGSGGRATGGEHAQNIGMLARKNPGVVARLNPGFGRDFREFNCGGSFRPAPDRERRGYGSECEPRTESRELHFASQISCRSVSTRLPGSSWSSI